MFFVSRQMPYYQRGQLIVEVASGGVDYAGSDMLVERYAGEMQSYADPREAVEAAIRITREWRAAEKLAVNSRKILIGTGSTGGGLCEIEGESFKAARKWARAVWEKLPKCPVCGKPLPEERKRFRLIDDCNGDEFCSESCAEKEYEFQQAALAEFEKETRC